MKQLILVVAVFVLTSCFQTETEVQTNNEFLTEQALQQDYDKDALEQQLNKGLSSDISSRVKRRSGLFTHNISASKLAESSGGFSLKIRFFDNELPLTIVVSSVNSIRGRSILRGSIAEKPSSRVRLVLYKGGLSGIVNFHGTSNIYLIQNVDQVSAVYEINAAD